MIINYTSKDLDLLARIMRSEAQTEGELGMLMVGNVVVNRVLADCYTFKDIDSVSDAIYQPNQFVGADSPLFYGSATTNEKNLAKRILMGEYYYPATHALWFYAPGNSNTSCQSKWYNQPLAGKYKNHCFYRPDSGICPQIY